MTQAGQEVSTRDNGLSPISALAEILSNPLLLLNTAPYLPASGLLNLAATNKGFRDLVYHTAGVFHHLDLTPVRAAQFDIDEIDHGGEIWRNVQLDENLTEDDFYSGPLRGVFSTLRRRDILKDVQTLILDGLSVTSEMCYEIINDPAFNVRILSIRDVKNLNQGKLRGALHYACRSSRPEGAPKLQGLYVFGSKHSVPTTTPSSEAARSETASVSISSEWNQKSQKALTSSLESEGDAWWYKKGRVISKHISDDWVNCMLACENIIAFDAILCQGPRHRNSVAFGTLNSTADHNPAVATFAVSGCENCGRAPEGLLTPDSRSPMYLPLLSPPPLLSSTIRAATTPQQPWSPFTARCADCLRERYCAGCNKWWCEACYQIPDPQAGGSVNPVVTPGETIPLPVHEHTHHAEHEGGESTTKPKARISKSCWECGSNCNRCIDSTQRTCKKCCAGYCIIHNEGSSPTFCDWCVSRGRNRTRRSAESGSNAEFSPPENQPEPRLMRLRHREQAVR